MTERLVNAILVTAFILAASFFYNEVNARIFCKTEKIEDVNALSVNDRFFQGLAKLRPDHQRVEKESSM